MKTSGIICILFLISCTSKTREENVSAVQSKTSQLQTENPDGVNVDGISTLNNSSSYTFSPEILRKTGDTVFKIQELLKKWQPDTQTFVYTSDRDTILRGSGKTLIAIPAGTLERQDGRPVKGAVKVKLVEYTTMQQFVAAGLVTQTDHGELLKTRGMVELRCYQGKQELRIKKGQSIALGFAGNADTSVYTSWSGVADPQQQSVVWKKEIVAEENSAKNDQSASEMSHQEKPQPLTRRMKSNMSANFLQSLTFYGDNGKNQAVSLYTTKGSLWSAMQENQFIISEKMENDLEEGKYFFTYEFRLDPSGNIGELQVSQSKLIPEKIRNLSEKYREEVQKNINTNVKVAVDKTIPTQGKYKLTITFGNASENRKKANYTAEMAEEDLKNGVNTVDALSKLGNSVGKISGNKGNFGFAKETIASRLLRGLDDGISTIIGTVTLGLINCDAIAMPGVKYRNGAVQKVLSRGFKGIFYLVFKNMRSIISTQSFNSVGISSFTPVLEKNLPIRIIGVYEIDGVAMIGFNDTKVSDNPEPLLYREKFSKEKLNELLQ